MRRRARGMTMYEVWIFIFVIALVALGFGIALYPKLRDTLESKAARSVKTNAVQGP